MFLFLRFPEDVLGSAVAGVRWGMILAPSLKSFVGIQVPSHN